MLCGSRGSFGFAGHKRSSLGSSSTAGVVTTATTIVPCVSHDTRRGTRRQSTGTGASTGMTS